MKMKLVQCPNKHYYDADKYSECPVCNPSSAMKQSRVAVEDDDDKTVALNVDEAQAMPSPTPAENNDLPRFDPKTGKPLYPQQPATPANDEMLFDPETGERLVKDAAKPMFDPETGNKLSETNDHPIFDPETGERLVPEEDDQTKPLEMPEAKPVARNEDIQEMIQHSTATVSEDDDATVPLYASGENAGKSGRGYVVGWLVAVNGPAKGKSYELYAGKNSIGRLSSQDVCIDNDRSIARNKHAVVIFDPKAQTFIAMPGESKELYYVNDTLVLGPVTLKAKDQLSLGETELMLIPLCDDSFTWNSEKED